MRWRIPITSPGSSITIVRSAIAPRGWSPATFDHNNTAFQLTGAHTTAQCALCHVNGQFHGTPTDCWSCHQGNFNQTTNPNHVTAQFSHACNDCHSTTAWQPASFDHGATAFPLTGAHTTVNCTQCHINNVYTGTPTACYACHQDDFEGVTDPNHVTNQFDHDCTVCHSTVDWSPATFNHASTAFPLTGAHTAVQCNLLPCERPIPRHAYGLLVVPPEQLQ